MKSNSQTRRILLRTALCLTCTYPASLSFAQGGASALEEVVITARKREEGLQDTPIAVSAFSSNRLEAQGISKINRLQDLTPNLVFQNTPSNSGVGSNAAVFIRGIGQKDFAPTTEPGVGIYVDGVYLSRTVGSVFDMIDIDRVEILRGPQGTLFGRNTIGGAISITTQKPNDEFSGKIDTTLGTDNRIDVRGAINIPLTDNFFMRASLASFEQDGYVKRPFDSKDLGNQDNVNGRLAFRWEPIERLTIDLAMEYGTDKTNGPPILITRVDTPEQTPRSFVTGHNAFAGGGNPYNCFGPEASPACYTNDTVVTGNNTNLGTGPNYSDLDTEGAYFTLEWEADNFTFKSITAYRSIDGSFAQDRDGGHQEVGTPLTPDPDGPYRNPINHVSDTFVQDQFSQEFQLLGDAFNDRMQWNVGLYYFEEDGENLNPNNFFPVSIQSGGYFDYTSIAVYGQTTYNITDALRVTAGLRYTEDDRDYLPDQYIQALPLGPQAFPCFVPSFHIPCEVGDRIVPYETVNNSIEEVTPYLNLSYDIGESTMVYATYSEGYKSDGFTQRVFPPEPSLPSFDPEYVDSYELGAKAELMDGKMRLNTALFYTEYTEMQLLVADASRIGPFTTNAGEATMQGVELELSWVPAADWRVDFGLGYLDASYDKINPGAEATGLTLDSPFTLISEWNINASLEKTFRLPGGSTLLPRVDVNYRSEFYTNANGIPFRPGIAEPLFQPDYHVVNASVRWNSPSERFHATAGVTNLNDENYRIFGDYQPGFGFDMQAYDRGRQWFLTLGYAF
ncbi:TonB-dependent receptor [Parahaliea mediterranea]|uniref:TonB-dependent receptor n=1 Tax=Parahaliea mediterranea TaxID=651086 RepID=UPI000E2EAFE0|nr:TonB-dependent receptor [Parahaliea mediterranea]